MVFVWGCHRRSILPWFLAAVAGCSGAADQTSPDASSSERVVILDCEGPPANPAGQLRFSSCQVTTTNGDPSASCARDQTGAGTGTLSLVLLTPATVRVGDSVALDSADVAISGAFTTSAITAGSVDGEARGSVTFTALDLDSPRRIEGAFSADASMRFRPDPSYTCALRGGFQAGDATGT